MGLQEVIEEVEADAQQRAKAILDEAKTEARAILDKARADAEASRAQRMREADAAAARIREQAASHADFEARKQVLEAEARLRATLRATLIEGFARLPAAKRNKHLDRLLAAAQAVVPEGRVWGAAADEKRLRASPYEFAGATDIAGGCIVESKDGRVRLDLSYETLLADRWRDILRQEAKLFG